MREDCSSYEREKKLKSGELLEVTPLPWGKKKAEMGVSKNLQLE